MYRVKPSSLSSDSHTKNREHTPATGPANKVLHKLLPADSPWSDDSVMIELHLMKLAANYQDVQLVGMY
jgi:hypothetical protein